MTPSSTLPLNKKLSSLLPHRVPMLFIAAFLVVIAVNGALIFFAEQTFSGLETEHPYERGLQYNQALDAQAAQERLGWHQQAEVTAQAAGQYSLQVRMTDRDGRALSDLTIEAHLVRPSSSGMDLLLPLRSTGDGSYVATFTLPALGQWDLRVVARQGMVAWQRSERLFLK